MTPDFLDATEAFYCRFSRKALKSAVKWCCFGGAKVPFPTAERIKMDKASAYGGRYISVSTEVAEFLESDDRRLAAQERSDRRHLSKSDFETVSVAQKMTCTHSLEDLVI